MKLTITENWLKFKAQQVEFGDFNILTGVNGIGKTQLLKNITELYAVLQLQVDGIVSNNFKYFPINSLTGSLSFDPLGSIKDPKGKIAENYSNKKRSDVRMRGKQYSSVQLSFEEMVEKENQSYSEGIKNIANKLSKSVDQLTEEEIRKHYDLSYGIPSDNMLAQNVLTLIHYYENEKHKNRFRKFLNNEGDNVSFFTDEEFIEEYGINPQIVINDILKRLELPLEVFVDKQNIDNFLVYIKHKETNRPVNTWDLSSGESVMFALAIALYNKRAGTGFPNVLLLDEPDASLHPSLTKKFLDTLYDVFVCSMGLKIIMTTHSPSTIALAPAKTNLYVMDGSPVQIRPENREIVIKKLTVGVPTLSVKIENRKIVFVESHKDASYYSTIYNIIKSSINSEYSLEFIPSGEPSKNTSNMGVSGCDEVRRLVNKLRANGVENVFGLIDFDNKNNSSPSIKVLGDRNGIENYIFDPLPLAAFLSRKEALLGLKDINESDYKFSRFASLSNESLQKITDSIVTKLQENVDKEYINTNTFISEYIGGYKIRLPEWYKTIDDHEFETIVKKSFNKLNSKDFQNEGALKMNIINAVFSEYEIFMPIEISTALRQLIS